MHPTVIHGNGFQDYLVKLQSVNNVLLNGLIFEQAVKACVVIMNSTNLITIENCIFRDNILNVITSFRALHIAGTNTNVNGCVFYNNGGTSTDGHAISILSSGTGTKIVNCIFANNNGPAIVNGTSGSPQTELINCTIVNNTANASTPGGVSVVSPALALRGCILWGNTTSRINGTQIDSAAEIKFCCIQGGIPGGILKQPTGAIYEYNTYNTPAFTRTTIPSNIADFYNWDDGVVPFLPSSADVINKATFSRDVGRPDYDLRSRRRSSPGFDMGAYETYDP